MHAKRPNEHTTDNRQDNVIDSRFRKDEWKNIQVERKIYMNYNTDTVQCSTRFVYVNMLGFFLVTK